MKFKREKCCMNEGAKYILQKPSVGKSKQKERVKGPLYLAT